MIATMASSSDNNAPLGAAAMADNKHADDTLADHSGRASSVSADDKSPGVRRAEALAAVLTTRDRVFIFLGVFLVAFAYGLDGTVRYAYQPKATESFSQ